MGDNTGFLGYRGGFFYATWVDGNKTMRDIPGFIISMPSTSTQILRTRTAVFWHIVAWKSVFY